MLSLVTAIGRSKIINTLAGTLIMEALTLCHDLVKSDKARLSPNVTSTVISIKVLNCLVCEWGNGM